jgi:hypothetical protein
VKDRRLLIGAGIVLSVLFLPFREGGLALGEHAAREPRSVTKSQSLSAVAGHERIFASVSRDAVERFRTNFQHLDSLGPAAKGEVDELLSNFRETLSRSNIEATARSLPPQDLAAPLGNVVLEAWLAFDPVNASAWIAARPDHTDTHAWLVAHELTQQPAILAHFCKGVGTDEWAQTFLDYASRDLLQANPPAALALAQSMVSGPRQARVLDSIAADWMDRQPSAAGAWISTLRDPDLHERIVAVGAASYASQNPPAAIEWLLAQSPADSISSPTLQAIIKIWLEVSPNQAAAWLHLLSANKTAALLGNTANQSR